MDSVKFREVVVESASEFEAKGEKLMADWVKVLAGEFYTMVNYCEDEGIPVDVSGIVETLGSKQIGVGVSESDTVHIAKARTVVQNCYDGIHND